MDVMFVVVLAILPVFFVGVMAMLHLALIVCELTGEQIALLRSSSSYQETFFDTFYYYASAKRWLRRMLEMILAEAGCLTAVTWGLALGYFSGETIMTVTYVVIALELFAIAILLNVRYRNLSRTPLWLALRSANLKLRLEKS